MKSLRPLLFEARGVVSALREELDPASVGPILVTGMLAEQLARQLAKGSEPDAVAFMDPGPLARSAALVHVIAGSPSADDGALVGQADRHGVPVILIQLWPQEDWSEPFVLTPFVVECRAGEGFPIPEIAARIVEAVEDPVALSRRVPVLEEKVTSAVVGTTVIRSAVLATLGRRSRAARPLITLEQIRMLAELRTLKGASAGREGLKAFAPVAAGVVGAGFAFREAARAARRTLPAPLVDAAVAAVGTWAVAEVFRRLEERGTESDPSGSVRDGT
jgi:hypothetical protein